MIKSWAADSCSGFFVRCISFPFIFHFLPFQVQERAEGPKAPESSTPYLSGRVELTCET